MIIILLTLGVILIGFLCSYKASKASYMTSANWATASTVSLLIGGVALFMELLIIFLKPVDYRNFKIDYDTVKETMTNAYDIRDAAFTSKIIEINKTVRYCNEFKDSKWLGVFQSKQICELPLLEKTSDSNEYN